MSNWRYVQNGQAVGPVDTAMLQQLIDNGTLNGDSLVWKEGDPNWLPARNYPELKIPTSSAVPPSSGPSAQIPPNVPPPLAGTSSDDADVQNNKVFAVLAYIGLLFLVPLLAAPNSRFARYHTNQGIILFLASLIGVGGSMILMMIPFIGCIGWLFSIALMIAAFVLMIIGILNAANGRCQPLPFIGHFQLLK